MSKRRRLRPQVFLKAAARLQKDLDNPEDPYGSTCCDVLYRELKVLDLHKTPEFRLFKGLFRPTADNHSYWFGKPSTSKKILAWNADGLPYHAKLFKQNKNNQQRRILALLFAYEVAKVRR